MYAVIIKAQRKLKLFNRQKCEVRAHHFVLCAKHADTLDVVWFPQEILQEMAESRVKPNTWVFDECILSFEHERSLEGHQHLMKLLNECIACGVGRSFCETLHLCDCNLW